MENKPQLEKVETSPEIEEMMKKVKNINEPGTAYSTLNVDWKDNKNASPIETLHHVLKEGLLGRSSLPQLDYIYGGSIKEMTKDKEGWAKAAREKHPIGVFFNVVGRASDIKRGDDSLYHRYDKKNADWNSLGAQQTEIAISPYITPGSITVLFDASSLKESETLHKDIENRGDMKTKTYYSSSLWNETNPDSEYGFVASYRVAPRFITGLVVTDNSRVEEIVKVMQEASDGDITKMLPIYDTQGNVLFPKEIKYADLILEKSDN